MKTPSAHTIQTIPIPPDILREIESFEEEAAKLLKGDLSLTCSDPSASSTGSTASASPVSR